MDVDVRFAGALVVDGTGTDPFTGDVGVRGDTIAFVSRGGAPEVAAERVVDCSGLVLTPGFVDIHTHSDLSFLTYPSATSKVVQGVTTEVVGNCGFSAFPVARERRQLLAELVRGVGIPCPDIDWDDFDGYAKAVDAAEPVTNVAALVGHGALRIAAAGNADVPVDDDLLGDMSAALRLCLEQGAFGMSTGLTYVPSMFAPSSEVETLAGVLREYDALYATHARATLDPFDACEEALDVGRRTGAAVLFSHVALNDPRMWGRAGDVIARFTDARAAGVDVGYDVYPYHASASSLTQYLPAWTQEQGEQGLRSLPGDRALYSRARRELAQGLFGSIPWEWERVLVSLAGPGDENLEGRTIGDIAEETGGSGEEVCLELCARHGNAVQVILFYRSEADVAEFLAHPLAIVGSDGNALPVDVPGRPHPRSFGTHARLLSRYVRDEDRLPLADAVRKSTAAPAERLGLRRRGRIAAGAHADLALLHLGELTETATWTQPCQLATGVRQVWVNGTQVVTDGALTGARPGHVLRRAAD